MQLDWCLSAEFCGPEFGSSPAPAVLTWMALPHGLGGEEEVIRRQSGAVGGVSDGGGSRCHVHFLAGGLLGAKEKDNLVIAAAAFIAA